MPPDSQGSIALGSPFVAPSAIGAGETTVAPSVSAIQYSAAGLWEMPLDRATVAITRRVVVHIGVCFDGTIQRPTGSLIKSSH